MSRAFFSNLLLGLFSILSAQTPACDYNNQYMYYGKCVNKECVDTMLTAFKTLIQFGPSTGGPGQFSVSAAYDPTAARGYTITLSYPDGAKGKYLLADQVNCVGFAVYSMTDETFTKRNPDAIAINKANPEGVIATWPKATYIQGNFRGSIIVSFAQSDLITYCKSTFSNQVTTYTCYFDLAFQIAGSTQLSNYFSIQISQSVGYASVNLQINKKAQTAPQLVKEIQVATRLEVCNTQVFPCPTPISNIFVGDPFYLRHSIIDASFKSWKINNYLVIFSGPNIGGILPLITTQFKGYNIYSAQAELQQKEGFKIIASGILSPNRRILVGYGANNGKIVRQYNNQIKRVVQNVASKVTFSENQFYTGTPFLLNKPALGQEYFIFLNLTESAYNTTKYITQTSIEFVTKIGHPPFKTVQSTIGSNVYKFVQQKAVSNQQIKITGVLQTRRSRILATQQNSKSVLYVRQSVQLPQLF